MTETTTADLASIIKERRERIRRDAPCEGCGATLAFCEAQRGKDPTAPEWFGCCAQGTGMTPCSHRRDPRAQDALLREIEDGAVRTVAEIDAEEADRKTARRRPIAGMSADQSEWWRQKNGEWIRIADMKPSHRGNTARMLLRGARFYAARYSMAAEMELIALMRGPLGPSETSADGIQDEMHREAERREADPIGWLTGTPLYVALLDGLPEEELTRTALVEQAARDLTPVCMIPDCGCSGEVHA